MTTSRRNFMKQSAAFAALASIVPGKLFAETTSENENFSIVCGPFLHHMALQFVSICWFANKTCTSWIEYGPTEQLGSKAFNDNAGLIDANVEIQHVTIDNLEAGSKYFYRVASKEIKKYEAYKVEFGETVYSPLLSFETFADRQEDFSFLCMNDIHGNVSLYDKFLVDQKDFAFVSLNGDVLSHIDTENQIRELFINPCVKHFASVKPMVYVRGNHETRGPQARTLSKYFGYNDNTFFYSFTYGNVYFMVLDTGEDKPDDHKQYYGLVSFDQYRSRQAEWMRKEFETKAYKKAKIRVCLSHIPVSLSKGDGWHGTTECREKFAPLLNKEKFHLLVCGHTHKAELIRPADNNYYIAMGGGPKPEQAILTKVEVKSDKLHVSLIKADGSLFDQCIVEV